jgi:hypothetical protein
MDAFIMGYHSLTSNTFSNKLERSPAVIGLDGVISTNMAVSSSVPINRPS